jgi:soluble lytic murein transglycosylase-like protein
VRIRRGDEPDWYDAAVAYNRGPNGNSRWALSKKKLDELGVHASEYSWIGTDFDQILDNNGTLDHLYNQVKYLAQDPLSSKEDHS